MAGPTPPPERKAEGQTPPPPVRKMGRLGSFGKEHQVTPGGKPLSTTPSRLNPYAGGPFKHNVKALKAKGGWMLVIRYILSRIFSFIRPPVFPSAEEIQESRSIEGELNQLRAKGKKLDSPEVQDHLKTIFKVDVKKLQKTPHESLEKFTEEINAAKDFVENAEYWLQPGTAFVDEQRGQLIQELNALSKQVFEEKFQALQKYSLETDPIPLFKFYALLSQMKGLDELKSKVESYFSEQLEIERQSVLLPHESIDRLAKEMGVNLKGIQLYGEKVALMQKNLEEQLSGAQSELKKAIGLFEETQSSLEKAITEEEKKKGIIETSQKKPLQEFKETKEATPIHEYENLEELGLEVSNRLREERARIEKTFRSPLDTRRGALLESNIEKAKEALESAREEVLRLQAILGRIEAVEVPTTVIRLTFLEQLFIAFRAETSLFDPLNFIAEQVTQVEQRVKDSIHVYFGDFLSINRQIDDVVRTLLIRTVPRERPRGIEDLI